MFRWQVSIQFGETEMLLEDVIKLGVGSIIELNSGVDEPVKLIVNGRCFARGEVVTCRRFLRNQNNGDYQCH
jgi:flagellar motor switch protein FliN/FliY